MEHDTDKELILPFLANILATMWLKDFIWNWITVNCVDLRILADRRDEFQTSQEWQY